MFLKKIFLSLSFLFFSLNLSAEYYGAGMLLYYKDIEAQEVRFIFGYDSESKNITWGDLGGRCDWRVDRSFEHAAARFAYYATKGIFIELEESLVDNYERVCEEDVYFTDEEVEVEYVNINGTISNTTEIQKVEQTRLICNQVKNGTKWIEVDEWLEYDYSVMKAGTYDVKLTATKKPQNSVDWVSTIAGAKLSDWAVWGTVENFSIYPVAQYRL